MVCGFVAFSYMELFNIYTLVDPRDPENVRYVGKTKAERIKKRLIEHCYAKNLKTNTHHNYWIKTLLKSGFKPTMNIIASCKSEDAINITETQAIKQYRSWGYNLVNATDGGEGSVGYRPNKKTRVKISASLIGNTRTLGHKLSEEHKAKISAGNKGKYVKSPSIETRHKIAAALCGRKHTPETRAKMSATHKKIIFTPEHRANLSVAITKYYANKKLGLE